MRTWGSFFSVTDYLWMRKMEDPKYFMDCAGADIVILAAGVVQEPGETKINLLKRNAVVIAKIVPQIVRYTNEATLDELPV